MNNEFAVLGQGFSTHATSWGEPVFYEESPTGSGVRESVLIDRWWIYCPSSALMHPQTAFDGIARGSHVTWRGCRATVLSVYLQPGVNVAQACIMLDNRHRPCDRQGVPADQLVAV